MLNGVQLKIGLVQIGVETKDYKIENTILLIICLRSFETVLKSYMK